MSPKRPFEEVVSAHGPTIWRACRAVLGPADADDVWSETFLSALEAYPRLPGGANVEAWLVTIARRKAIDTQRRSSRHAVPMADLPARADTEAADRRDLDLASSLARLPDKQRWAVVCHYLAGLPYKEVAAAIGGSTDSARRAAADGVAALRRSARLSDPDDPPTSTTSRNSPTLPAKEPTYDR